MDTVTATAPARVALAGNPSDGFGGRTLSLAIANYDARVTVAPAAELTIVPVPPDEGGLRLLKAAVRRFADHCAERGTDIGERTFSITYETNVPRAVGLGGSSAIVTAAIRALAELCGVEIDRDELPGLALSVETRELGIAAGLQDRVAQAYGGLTYMDFDPALAGEGGRGAYEPLDPALLPPLFVAHLIDAGEPSGVFHSRLRQRFDDGEAAVVEAMSRLGDEARRARDAVIAGDTGALGRAMDASFELRRSIAALHPRQARLVELAREHGAAANYSGSGGAIVGLLPDPVDLEPVADAFEAEGCGVATALASRPTLSALL